MKDQDKAIRMNFGKYEIPEDMKRLIDLDHWHETRSSMKILDMTIGFMSDLGGFRYYCTPSDVIVFGSNGCDGIHYGFLTDFSTVDNLSKAPIVCISPMDFGHTNKLIARNFRDFLSMHLDHSELFYNDFKSEDDYMEQVEIWRREEAASPYRRTPEEKQYAENIKTMLREKFQLPIIDQPYRYIQDFQEERRSQAVVTTRDSLHVVLPTKFGEALAEERKELELMDIENEAEVQTFLKKASIPAALALVRDVEACVDHPSLQQIQLFLKHHGFHDEVLRMQTKMS